MKPKVVYGNRRQFSREFKPESVKQVKERGADWAARRELGRTGWWPRRWAQTVAPSAASLQATAAALPNVTVSGVKISVGRI